MWLIKVKVNWFCEFSLMIQLILNKKLILWSHVVHQVDHSKQEIELWITWLEFLNIEHFDGLIMNHWTFWWNDCAIYEHWTFFGGWSYIWTLDTFGHWTFWWTFEHFWNLWWLWHLWTLKFSWIYAPFYHRAGPTIF